MLKHIWLRVYRKHGKDNVIVLSWRSAVVIDIFRVKIRRPFPTKFRLGRGNYFVEVDRSSRVGTRDFHCTVICRVLLILLFAANFPSPRRECVFLHPPTSAFLPLLRVMLSRAKSYLYPRLFRGKREDECLMDLAPYGGRRWSWFWKEGRFFSRSLARAPGEVRRAKRE